MKRLRSSAIFLSAVGMVLAATSAQASHQVTKSYVVASPVAVQASAPGGASLGGAWFSAGIQGPDERPSAITVNDASGGPISFMVCQDLDGDSICGNRDPSVGAIEPRVAACAVTSDLSGSPVPFDKVILTRVFILTATVDCPNLASTGTITVSFS